jgi:jumonji domain-containing protein 7
MGIRNADSPTRNKDGELVFVKPWEEQQIFSEFVDFVSEQEKTGSPMAEIRYAQTRDSPPIHLFEEYSLTLYLEYKKTTTSAMSTPPSSQV